MTVTTIDVEERERRRHVLQWTRFMIAHLERGEEVRHLAYDEALIRLRDLLEEELERASG